MMIYTRIRLSKLDLESIPLASKQYGACNYTLRVSGQLAEWIPNQVWKDTFIFRKSANA